MGINKSVSVNITTTQSATYTKIEGIRDWRKGHTMVRVLLGHYSDNTAQNKVGESVKEIRHDNFINNYPTEALVEAVLVAEDDDYKTGNSDLSGTLIPTI